MKHILIFVLLYKFTSNWKKRLPIRYYPIYAFIHTESMNQISFFPLRWGHASARLGSLACARQFLMITAEREWQRKRPWKHALSCRCEARQQ